MRVPSWFDIGRSNVRRAPAAALIALISFFVSALPATAGTASLDGNTGRFVDSSGADDHLQATFERDDDALWSINFFAASGPEVQAGPGCAAGLVGFDCPTGAVPPAVSVDLGGGDDELDVLARQLVPGQPVTISAGPGDDVVTKYQAGAVVDLGPGEDVVHPDNKGDLPPAATPGDVIRGGQGSDTVDYSDAIDPIDVSLDGVADDGREGEGDNLMPDIENVVGSEFGGDIVGSRFANVLDGGGAERRTAGGGGHDRLKASGTLDALDGRGGDRVECLGSTDVVWADGGDVVEADCAKVTWAPAVKSVKTDKRRHRTVVRLSCPRGVGPGCSGKVHLTTSRGKKLASARYGIRRGEAATVTLRLKRSLPARPS